MSDEVQDVLSYLLHIAASDGDILCAGAHRIITELQAENARLRGGNERMKSAVDDSLSARMEAAGMIPLDAMTKPDCLTRFSVHAGMTDLGFYAEWLERKAKEYGRMQAAHQTGEREPKEDMFNFILGKSGAFKEALENHRAALNHAEKEEG